MPEREEFREIAHCGGQFIATVSTDANGQRGLSFGVTHTRPVPASLIGVYALPQGIPVGMLDIPGSIPPPFPFCFQIFIASDSEGLFGHECPTCTQYWRSQGASAYWAMTCPYCGLRADGHRFLTAGQRRFVDTMCAITREAIDSEKDGDVGIDMDKVADEVVKTGERPSFYYAEKSQQNRFTCAACRGVNDILGRYGYCANCGTRNDLQEFTGTIDRIQVRTRERIAAKELLHPAVQDSVSAFDSMAKQYAKQLAQHVPMTPARRTSLKGALFHNPKARAAELKPWFDIDIFDGIATDDQAFLSRMFLRRHVYEHNGGQVNQEYLDKSGDTSVKLGQALRETPDDIFRLIGLILKMGRNLHDGFHQLFPPVPDPIRYETERKARLDEYRRGR
jgi:hypothetical protein